jgi:hypothetical protein
MLRHKKPFKSSFEIREYENKRKKLRDRKHVSKVRDDSGNRKIFQFEDNNDIKRDGKDIETDG